MRRVLLLIILLLPLPAVAGDGGVCAPFLQVLLQVPHTSLERRDGLFTSQWSQHCVEGCLLEMETDQLRADDQLLGDLRGDPGTPLYLEGWRGNPALTANGAGTGMVGLEKDGIICLVFTEQPSYVGDDGRIVQSETLRVRVECPVAIQADGPCPGEESCGGSCK